MRGIGSAFHILCPRHSGPLTPTVPTDARLHPMLTIQKVIQVV